ncbi:MAG: hypothetical protein PUD80_02925, partial [Firmicutes bacterium]|nr:hypothetical protein [Bacillota bacterium]
KNWPQPKGFGKGCKPNASYDTSVLQPVIYHIVNFLLVDGSHLFTSQNHRTKFYFVCLMKTKTPRRLKTDNMPDSGKNLRGFSAFGGEDGCFSGDDMV